MRRWRLGLAPLGLLLAASCSANERSPASGVPGSPAESRARDEGASPPFASSANRTDDAGAAERTAAASPAQQSAPALVLAPPSGWTAWGMAPPGCTLWIPESRAALERLADLSWQACPFQAVGCSALGAPWAARTGWGFGGRLGAVAAGDRTYLTFTRQIDPDLWETVVLSGPAAGPSERPTLRPVAAWRQRLPEAGCVLGSVALTVERGRVTAALPVIRAEAENAPWIYLGVPEALWQPPEPALARRSERTSRDEMSAPLDEMGDEMSASRDEMSASRDEMSAPLDEPRDEMSASLDEPRDGTRRLERFGGPGAEVMASGVAIRRGELLVVAEHEGRFAVRDLTSGETFRPAPPDEAPGSPSFRALLEPAPLGGAVVFTAWRGERNSVWSTDRHGRTAPLLRDARASFDRFTSDGRRAAWLRSTGFRDLNTFDRVELWTAELATTAPDAGGPSLVSPRRVRSLPAGPAHPLPLLSVGDGWAALWRGEDQVLLVRLSDGELRRLPAVPALSWDGGSGGLAIAGGAVWARASLRGQAGNDLRLIARFSLEALPKGALL